MPIGIFLYEIEKSFGPQIIADYYITEEKVTPEILKIFNEKHIKKHLTDATHRLKNSLYYSSQIEAISKKNNYYLGFILKEEEDLISLKSIFEKIEAKIAQEFTPKDKKKIQALLKDVLNSTISLFEKLKEPIIIKDTINEKTKQMLDEGKLQEARELIDLGEIIPEKLSTEIKLAEESLKESNYKKAKKSYLKAADLAEQIRETEIVDLLKKKAEHVGDLPNLLKTRDAINKGIRKKLDELEDIKLEYKIYENLIPLIEKNIKLSYSLEDTDQIKILEKLVKLSNSASKIALDLKKLDDNIKSLLKKV